MFQFEFEKFRRQRILVAAVTLVMLAVYISSAFRGLELMGGWSQDYFWSHPEYREQMRSCETEYADDGWIRKVTEEYHAFVDENRRTDEEIGDFMEMWYDEEWLSMGEEPPAYEKVIADPYNFQYAHEVLQTEAYDSEEFEYFFRHSGYICRWPGMRRSISAVCRKSIPCTSPGAAARRKIGTR